MDLTKFKVPGSNVLDVLARRNRAGMLMADEMHAWDRKSLESEKEDLGCSPAVEDRFAAIEHTHSASLLRFLTTLTGGEHFTAEDILQETMLRAWRHIDSLPTEEDQLRRWLFTVARRIAIDVRRGRRTRPAELPLTDNEAGSSRHGADEIIADLTFRSAIERLSELQKLILSELYGRGISFSELAERLGIPVGTVKSRAHYAVRLVRAELAGDG